MKMLFILLLVFWAEELFMILVKNFINQDEKKIYSQIKEFLNNLLPDATIELVRENVANPVLSKLKVNIEDRYTI